jgi:hypothetical protein
MNLPTLILEPRKGKRATQSRSVIATLKVKQQLHFSYFKKVIFYG